MTARSTRLAVTAWLAMAVMLLLVAVVAQAAEIPRSAQQHRNTLTREARLAWGLDAPVPVFAAQIHQESGWNPAAVSRVGARGMAQFMPATAAWWCEATGVAQDECQPANPRWAIRALVGYDRWLFDRVSGPSERDRLWAALRSYNGGLGHWQAEARIAGSDRQWVVDLACGRARRSALHCPENLGYPRRILGPLQFVYAGWGRTL